MKIKRILSAFLVCVMIVGSMSTVVFASEADVWDGKSYSLDWLSSGNPEGTSGDKFYLNSAEDLAGFAYYVNNYASTNNIFTGDTVYLNVDVDLGNHEWTPIGTMTTDKKHFYGSFDGQGHTISNLKISKESGQIYGGLFGRFKSTSFKQSFSNLIIHNVDIAAVASSDGKEGAGALMGYGYDQIIDNVHVTGNVNISGNYYVGGLAGHSRSNISNSTVEATGSITGVSVTGGLVGYFVHATGNGYTAAINDCSVDGVSVESTNKNAGGLVGFVSETNADKIVIDDVSVSNVTVEATNTNVSYVAHNFSTVTNVTVENVATYVAGEETIPSDSEIVPHPVAEVNGVGYTSFTEVLNAVKTSTGNEITLFADVSVSGQNALDALTGDTLNLNDNTLTVNGNSYFNDGTTTFTNGDIVVTGYASDSYFCGYTESAVIVFDDVVVTGDDYTTGCALFNANLGKVEIKNSEITVSGDTTGGVIYGGAVTIDGTTINATNVCRGITNSVAEIKNSSDFTFDGGETGFNNSTVTVDASEIVIKNATKRAVRLDDNTLALQNGATLTATDCAEDIVAYDGESTAVVKVDDSSTLDAVNNIAPVEVSTYEELVAALEKDNANIIMIDNITGTATQSSGYGKAGIVLNAGDFLDGNGYKLTINGANSTWDCAIAMKGGEVKELTIAGAMRGIFMPGANGDVIIDTCVIEDVIYTFNSDAGSKDYTVTVKNTKLMGWTSFSNVHKSVTFENCDFGEGNGYAYCRPYQATTFTGCEFNEGFEFDAKAAKDDKLKFDECTYAGKPLSAETAAPMFSDGGTVIIDDETVEFGKYVPPVAQIGDTKYTTLEEAFKAVTAENNVVEILSDVTVDYYWDSRYTGAKFTVPVTINGNGHKLTFTNTVYDGGNQYSVFRFENDATVNNLTVDMKDAISEFQGRFRAISAKGNLTVSGCTFIGNGSANNTRAIIFGEGAGANIANLVVSITGSEFNGWRRAISDNENAQDSKSVTITGNKMTDASVYVSAHDEVVFSNNTVTGAYVNVKSYTPNNTLDVTATGNILTENTESIYNVINAGGKINAQDGFVLPWDGVTISNLEELKKFRDAVNAGDNYAGKTVVLNVDINLEGENWIPIGTETNAFRGTFDGQNHTISNLKIDNAELSYAGLFGYANGAKINNVKINNVDIHAYSQVGAIAGTVYTGSVSNCHVSGTIKLVADYAYAGGITSEGYVTVSDSSVIADGMGEITVKEKSMAGGITGWRGEGKNDIINCTVKNLNITAYSAVGAITGLVHYENTIDGCTANNVNLYKTRVNGQASIGLAAGNWSNKADDNYTITITNNSFDNISINGTAINSLRQLYGSNYSYYDKEIKLVESGNTYGNITTDFKVVAGSADDLEKAFAYANDGETITLVDDFELTKTIKNTKNFTLDLNGKTITGTDNATSSFALIEVQPDAELIITDTSAEKSGKITLTSTKNREWNAYSSVISNQRGKLIVNGGTIEHLGGTDMAYGIDNLTNTGAQNAETIINDGTIKSTYRAIRQFLNSAKAQNILTVNGGTIEGVNKSIWMQDANASANPGKLTVAEGATLNGDVYLYVAAGSTQWPVEVSIAKAAVNGEVLSANVPAGYEVVEENGYYGVVEKVDTPVLPEATVNKLGAITVDEYKVYNGSFVPGGEPIDLQIAMQFISQDTAETAKENYYANYTTDFFIKIDGLSSGSFVGDGCYLAGYYDFFGSWVKVPLDGMKIENGVVYPVLSSIKDLNFTYAAICKLVKDFKCGIYLTEDVLQANPNFNLTLSLGLSETPEQAQAGNFINVDEVTYVKDDFVEEKLNTNSSYIRNIETTNANGDARYQVILFAGIDSLKYKEVGFEITVDGDTREQSTNVVYTSYVAAGVRYTPDMWGEGCEYIFALPINFQTTFKDKSVTYRPFAIKLDGEQIYGKAKTIDKIYNK